MTGKELWEAFVKNNNSNFPHCLECHFLKKAALLSIKMFWYQQKAPIELKSFSSSLQ